MLCTTFLMYRSLSRVLTKVGDGFLAAGVNTYHLYAWDGIESLWFTVGYYMKGSPATWVEALNYSSVQANVEKTLVDLMLPLGIKTWKGYGATTGGAATAMKATLAAFAKYGCAMFMRDNLNGYQSADSGLETSYPSYRDYYLTQDPTTLALGLGDMGGITQDAAQQIVSKYLQSLYAGIAQYGRAALLGQSGAPESDYQVNITVYPGMTGSYPLVGGRTDGGHSDSNHQAFTLSPYFGGVASGNHMKDGTPCLLYRQFIAHTGSSTTLDRALDIRNYHRTCTATSWGPGWLKGGPSFEYYNAAQFAEIEARVFQSVSALLPNAVLRHANPVETQNSSVFSTLSNYVSWGDRKGWWEAMQATGGGDPSGHTLLNDTGEGANLFNTPANIPEAYLRTMPLAAHLPVWDIFYPPNNIGGVCQIPLLINPPPQLLHFGTLLDKMPYVGGFFGYEDSNIRLLNLARHYGDPLSMQILHVVARQWGGTDFSKLSLFDVAFTDSRDTPYTSADVAALQAFVQNGGGLVFTKMPQDASTLYNAFGIQPGQRVAYGNGRVVGRTTIWSAGLSSAANFDVLNDVLWAARQDQYVPAVYTAAAGIPAGVVLSICGKRNGQKAVWLSNNNLTPVTVGFNLSKAFYGFPDPYSLTDINTGQKVSGNGDVVVSLQVPAQDWVVLYQSTGGIKSSVLTITLS